MSCDAYPDLNFTDVVRSNLGGFGPDIGEEGLVLKAYDAQVRRHLHVVINAGPTYQPYHKSQNGLQGRCGLINIQTGTEVALHFSFRDAVTGRPAMLPQVAFTFFDLDQCEEHRCVEFITAHNISAYRLSPNTELMVLRPTIGEKIPTATFYATTAGDWFDNPRSKDTLTMTQMNRGVSVAFHHTSQVSLVFGASAGKGARYLSFMGFPGLLCIGKAATAENHFAPASGAREAPIPPKQSFPVHWFPANKGNLTGTLIIDNIDWSLLESRHAMAAEFEASVKEGIAEAAGAGVEPEDVTLSLEPGTIVIRATVQPPRPAAPARGASRRSVIDESIGGSQALRARLADSVQLGQVITDKVRAIPGIQQVSAGPINLTRWHLLPPVEAGTKVAVIGLALLVNVSYLPLMGNPALLQGLKHAISEGVATAAGGRLTPENTDVGVFAGAVNAHVAVRAPGLGSADLMASPDLAAGAGFNGRSAAGPPMHGRPGAGRAAAAAATCTRLQRRGGLICREVAKEVKSIRDIGEVTTGDVTARDLQLTHEASKGLVTGTFSIHNVDYELLAANPDLMSRVEEKVQQTIARTAGGGLVPEHVGVDLFAGNVVLRAMVSPGFGSRFSSRFGGRGSSAAGKLPEAHARNWRGDAICRAVTQEVRAVNGIQQANLTMQYHKVKHSTGHGLPSWRHLPGDSFEKAAEGGVVSCIAEGLDYGQLLLSPVLLSGVEQAVRRAVASQAGGLSPGDLTLSLHVGSVLAQVTVQPPASPAAAVMQRMGKHVMLDQKVWEKVQRVGGMDEVAIEGDGAARQGGLLLRNDGGKALVTENQVSPSVWGRLQYVGYGLIVLGLLILLCLSFYARSSQAVACRTPSRTREVYVYLPVGDSNGEATVNESEVAAALLPVEVAFRDFHNETQAVKFRYCDHGMRLTQDAPPKVASFSVNSYAREKGVQTGWTISRIGNHEVDRREHGEAVERLLRTRLERLPPAPLRLEFETTAGQVRTFQIDRQPLGVEFTKTAPFKVEHHKPDSLARECGIELGWTLKQVGTVKLSGATAFDTLMAYLNEGLRGLPQDPSGPRLKVEFADPAGNPRVLFFQRRPLGFRLRSRHSPAANGRRNAVVIDAFDFNSHAKDRGAQIGWAFKSVGEQDVSHSSEEEVAKLLLRHTANLPLWPLRIDFVPVGSSGTRTFYFEHQPLGLEFTKAPPLRVDHFKPDSLAQALGVRESWSLVRIGDAVVSKSTGIKELMGYIQAGLDHLPQEPKGMRVDFLDAIGRRRRCHFQRRPVGLVLSKHPPTCVESFAANSYARERGVQVGWTVVRVGEQDLPPSASPQEAESLLEEQSASLPLWPLRVDFDVGKGTIRTLYFDHQPYDLAITTSPPFRIQTVVEGGPSAASGVEPGWVILRVGHTVVGGETDHATIKRSLVDGSAHLAAPPRLWRP